MEIINYHEIKPELIYFGKRILYLNKPLYIMTGVKTPFGINKTKTKTNIKLKCTELEFINLIKKLETLTRSKYPSLDYVPLLKVYNSEYYFLATIQKELKLEYQSEEISEDIFFQLNKPMKAYLDFRYIWTLNNTVGITVIVKKLSID